MLLVLITLAVLVPFLGKPFNVDDALFVWLGQHLHENPWDFYGFLVNWHGSPEPMYEITKNPPLTGYFIAVAGLPFGFRESVLHMAFLAPAVGAVVGTFFLARRLCQHPFEAAVLAAAAPVFVVCATSVMSDVSSLALFCWALYTWIAGLDRDRWGLLALSGCLAAAAALTKYFGLSVVPLCLAWGLLHRRGLGLWCAPLLIPIAAVAAYEWGTLVAYGNGLFSDAAFYATEGGEIGKPPLITTGAIGLIFLGACFVPAVFYAPYLWSPRILLAAVWVLALGVFVLGGELHPFTELEATAPPIPFPNDTKFQMMVTGLAGVGLLAAAALEVVRRREPASVLLALWLGGTFVFATFLNWTNNGRSILPLVPAAAILLVRRLEWRFPGPSPSLLTRLRLLSVPGIAVALAVAWADARWAHSIRDEAQNLLARYHSAAHPLRFQGHWGFQYYMQLGGARVLNTDGEIAHPGELLAVAANNVAELDPAKAPLEPVETTEQNAPRWVRTHAWQLGAGFYSSAFGPLPYAFGHAWPDRYDVYRVQEPFRFVPGFRGPAPIEVLRSARAAGPRRRGSELDPTGVRRGDP
jgi:hypothetical protein